MKYRQLRRIVVNLRVVPVLALAALISILAASAPAHAANGSQGAPANASPPPALALPPAPASFRGQLQSFYEQMAQAGRSNPGLDKKWNLVGNAGLGEEALSVASPQQLDAAYQAISSIPDWQQAAGELALQTETSPRGRERRLFRTNDIAPGSTCVENGVAYPEPGLSVLLGLQDAQSVADIALELLPDSDVYGAIVAGEGIVATSPVSIERTLVKVATIGVEAAAIAAQNAHDLYEECSGDAHAALLQTVATDLETDTTNILAAISNLKADLDSSVGAIEAKLTSISGQVTTVQTTLDTSMETRQIHLSVVPLPSMQRLLVSTTESGQPVTTTLVSVRIASPTSAPLTFSDVTSTVTASAPSAGVLELAFPSSQPNNTVYQIEVKETSTIDGQSATHYGTVLYSEHS